MTAFDERGERQPVVVAVAVVAAAAVAELMMYLDVQLATRHLV